MNKFALVLEYTNHFGETVFRYLPVYRSLDECNWWRGWFVEMVTGDHATVISAVCKAVGA